MALSYGCPAGRRVPVPYKRTVARVSFGLISATRVRRWLQRSAKRVGEQRRDSTSCTSTSRSRPACRCSRCSRRADRSSPRSTPPSPARGHAGRQGVMQACVFRRSPRRIAVSELARKTCRSQHFAAAPEIPNRVQISPRRRRRAVAGCPGRRRSGFHRRSPKRARLPVPAEGVHELAGRRPGLRLLVPGPETRRSARRGARRIRDRIVFLGKVSETRQGAHAAQHPPLVAP